MALLDDDPELDLYDKDWVIHTRSEERAPAKVGPTAQVHRSLISHGCVIAGTVVNSVLSPGVRVDVGRRRARLDRHVRLGHPLGRGRRPGDPRQGGRGRPGRHRRRRARTTTGRTSRSRAGSTPASPSSASARSSRAASRIGRNVKVAADVRSSDFAGRVVRSGESVEPAGRRAAARRRGRLRAVRGGRRPERAVHGRVRSSAPVGASARSTGELAAGGADDAPEAVASDLG